MPSTAPARFQPAEYPRIAFSKLAAAYARVLAVQSQFRGKVDGIGSLLSGLEKLAGRASESSRALEPRIAELSELTGQIATGTRAAGELVKAGAADLRSAVEAARAAIGGVRALSESMDGVVGIAGEIAARVGGIADIAIENKVIAINASITASRAGDRVKGFKVIANEITRLSAAMADKVEAIVSGSTRVAERSSLIMEQMRTGVAGAEEALRSIESAFSLLEHADATIANADLSAGQMLGDEAAVAASIGALGGSLREVGVALARSAELARAGVSSIERQQAELESLDGLLASLSAAAARISSAGDADPERAEEAGLTLAMSEIPMSQYDPALATIVREYHYANFTCIRLLRYSSDLKLVPYLAETWSLADGERAWDFRLKRGVRFADGTELSAEDVRFSIERVLDPALGSPYANLLSVIEGSEAFARGEAEHVSGIVILDPYAVRFVLVGSFNYFLGLLAHSCTSIVKKDARWAGTALTREAVVSAGPFRSLPREEPGVDLLEANPEFVNGPPFFARLEIRRTVGDIAQAAASGQVGIAYNIPASLEADIRRAGFTGEARRYVSKYCCGLCVNFMRDNFLTRNVELRRALSMALDKDALIAEAFGRDAARADSMLGASILDIGGRVYLPHDAERARAIVAGYSGKEDCASPLTLAWVRNATSVGVDVLLSSVAASLASVGLAVRVVELPAEMATVEEYRKYDLVFLRFMPEPDLYAAVEPFINPEGGDNYFHYSNPAIFEELRRSIGIREEAERREYFKGLMERFSLDVFMVPLYFQKVLFLVGPGVRGAYRTVEESFLPEVAYEIPDGPWTRSLRLLPDVRLGGYGKEAAAVAEAIDHIGAGAGELHDGLVSMISTVLEQKARLTSAEAGAASVAGRADGLRARGADVVGSVGEAAGESRKSADASAAVLGSLSRLRDQLSGTAASLDAIMKDIRSMLGIVAAIEEFNSVIGSVAVNAAIISSKGESAKGDLLKVARAIGELAERNAANTAAIRNILERMAAKSAGDAESLSATVSTLSSSMRLVGASGESLSRGADALVSTGETAERASSRSGEMSAMALEASRAMADMAAASAELISAAETVKYGMEMQRAIVDILKDVGALNRELAGALAGS